MKRNTWKVFLWTVVLAGQIGFGPDPLAAKEPPGSAALDLARQLNQAFVEVADRVSPAVVVIRVAHKPEYQDVDSEDNPFFDMLPPELRRQFRERFRQSPPEEREKDNRRRGGKPIFDGQGSGIVIRGEGYILTNRHVVDGAERIEVRFKDGGEWYAAEVRGVDPQSDVAVIKIDPKGRKLAVATLGDSDKTRVGEFAVAIGAPFDLDYSVTFGHVSAKGRSRIIGGREGQSMDQDFIQTDANINPGNSGGPLININGEVIGINTLIRGLHTGIGFAIPSNLAREVSDKLISEGKYVRAWLGISVFPLKEDPEYRDLVKGVTDGVVVSRIEPNTPAAKSELKPTDIITSVDGTPVSNPLQLRAAVRSKRLGSTIALDVVRGGKHMKIEVKTEAWPEKTTPVVNKRSAPTADSAKSLGLTLQALTKDLAEQFGVEKTEGVVVTEVEPGSLAEQKGIRAGDLITEVNGKAVKTPKQFRDAVRDADLKKGVIINLVSEGAARFEILKDSGE